MGAPSVPVLTPAFVFHGKILLKDGSEIEGEVMTYARADQASNLGIDANAMLGVLTPEGDTTYIALHSVLKMTVPDSALLSSYNSESAYASGCFHADLVLLGGHKCSGNVSFYTASMEENVFGITDVDVFALYEGPNQTSIIPVVNIMTMTPREYTP